MVIEARDGFITSIKNGVKPFHALIGERSWSPLQYKEDWEEHAGGVVEKEKFSARGDLLHYHREYLIVQSGQWYAGYGQDAEKEEINDPSKPWYGKIRYRETDSGDTSPTKEPIVVSKIAP